MGASSQYQLLLEKLDQFIRKYYTNEMVRGGIFTLVYLLLFFLFINVLEYYLYLSPTLRKVLFFGFILSSLGFFIRFFLTPLFHFYKLGSVISHEQAASIIGNHFKEVKDKLINILQLNKLATLDDYSLVNASVNQKISDLQPITFSNAIDLSQNKKYLRYLLPTLFLFLSIVLLAPRILTEGSNRLFHNNTVFEKQAPFKFVIKNKSLRCLQFENYELEVTTEGDALPKDIFLEANQNIIKLKKKEQNLFTYEFVNLQHPVKFYLSANDFNSKEYLLDVIPKPNVAAFEIHADYPPYTGKVNEVIKSTGDLTVPAGTRLSWKFAAKNTTAIELLFGSTPFFAEKTSAESFHFSKSFFESTPYQLKISSDEIKNADSVSYSLSVVPDQYPVIQVEEKRDSTNANFYYYLGNISDDYGLKKLVFHYQIQAAEGSAESTRQATIDLPFSAGVAARFSYFWNTKDLAIQPGEKMTYYFEVWDNDGVHGSKSARSNIMSFAMSSASQMDKELAKDNKELKDDLKQSMKDAKDLQKMMKDLQDKMLEKKNLNWEDKKQISDALQKQKQLESQVKELKDKLSKNFEKQEDFKNVNESIKEKQKQLEELMNNVLSEEMKKLMEKLEKMLDEVNKKDALEKMEDLKANNEKVEKELDRMLELFKKLEYQQKLQETIEKLDKLAQKQEELAKQTENKPAEANTKEQQDAQKKLNDEAKDMKKAMEDMKKLQEDKKDDKDLKEAQEKMDDAQKDQEDSQGDMQKKDNKSASKKQKSAAENMKQASKKLGEMKKKEEEEEQAEDMQAIRQLLKNLLSLSFDEEKLIGNLKTTNTNTPKYVDLMKEQQRIKENSEMVEDSLYALAKRVFQIKSFVTKEMNTINKNLTHSLTDLEDRNIYKAQSDIQYAMTGYNNLALMLSESQQKMQQQQSESKPKDGKPKMCNKCKNPGNGQPKLSQMQKQLNDKISKLGEQMKKEGEGKPQKAGQGQPKSGLSKEFAELAAKQAEMRKALEKAEQEQGSKEGKNGKDGKEGQNGNNALKDALKKMEQTETDLVNKRLTNEMLKRQEEIMVKLLESEKADKERGEKPERESETAREKDRKIPPSLAEYLKSKEAEIDLYKTVPPSLKPYYKILTEKYFKGINQVR